MASQRLSVNINEESATVLRKVTQDRGITTTEAVRRAIGLLGFFEDARARNLDVLTRNERGEYERLMMQ